MAAVLVVSNQKGGVGKTTTCANLGAALAARRLRVLLLDLDPRADLSLYWFAEPPRAPSSYDLLLSPADYDPAALRHLSPAGLDLLPAHLDLAGLEFLLADDPARRPTLVRDALARLRDAYDFILIDTAPGLQLLSLSALAAADQIVIPQQCSFLALHGLRAVNDIIDRLHTQAGICVSVAGILLTMFDKRTVHHRQVTDMVRGGFGSLVFRTPIPFTIRVQEAAVARLPVTEYEPRSPAADAYRRLAQEVIQRAKKAADANR